MFKFYTSHLLFNYIQGKYTTKCIDSKKNIKILIKTRDKGYFSDQDEDDKEEGFKVINAIILANFT